jgi:hypothetical protein
MVELPAIGDTVIIGDGDLTGSTGRLMASDEHSDTAQVQVYVQIAGTERRALAVVTLSDLQVSRKRMEGRFPPVVRRPRGRPRTITEETVLMIHELHGSGRHSHAEIGRLLGVSKASVGAYLRLDAGAAAKRPLPPDILYKASDFLAIGAMNQGEAQGDLLILGHPASVPM